MLQIVKESSGYDWEPPTTDTSVIETERYRYWMEFFNKVTSTCPPVNMVELEENDEWKQQGELWEENMSHALKLSQDGQGKQGTLMH